MCLQCLGFGTRSFGWTNLCQNWSSQEIYSMSRCSIVHLNAYSCQVTCDTTLGDKFEVFKQLSLTDKATRMSRKTFQPNKKKVWLPNCCFNIALYQKLFYSENKVESLETSFMHAYKYGISIFYFDTKQPRETTNSL